jgi:GH18 family chitinase
MPASTTNRIAPQAAVTAVRAMLGSTVAEDVAIDVIEVIRPHLDAPYVALIESLRAELNQAREEIARLTQAQLDA